MLPSTPLHTRSTTGRESTPSTSVGMNSQEKEKQRLLPARPASVEDFTPSGLKSLDALGLWRFQACTSKVHSSVDLRYTGGAPQFNSRASLAAAMEEQRAGGSSVAPAKSPHVAVRPRCYTAARQQPSQTNTIRCKR